MQNHLMFNKPVQYIFNQKLAWSGLADFGYYCVKTFSMKLTSMIC